MMATMPQALNGAIDPVSMRARHAVSLLSLPGFDEFEVELAARIQENFVGLGV